MSSSLHPFKFLRASLEVGGDVAGDLGELGQVGDEVVAADCEAGALLLAEQGVGKDRGRRMCLVDGGGVSDLQAVVDCNKHNARRAVAAALVEESGGFGQVFGSFDASASVDPHVLGEPRVVASENPRVSAACSP